MSDDLILVTRDDTLATVTLNRPEKLNALTKPMWQRLGAVMRELSADDHLRCVVLRGAGGKAFAPGNDIAEFATERSNFAQGQAYGEILHGALEATSSYVSVVELGMYEMTAKIHEQLGARFTPGSDEFEKAFDKEMQTQRQRVTAFASPS